MRPGSWVSSGLTAIAVGVLSGAVLCAEAAAADLSGFTIMAQLGPNQPWAIQIAPNHQWFLTGERSLHIWDLKTGAVLRELKPARPGRLTRVSISDDGRMAFARNIPDGEHAVEETVGWFAETGLPISDAAMRAPALEAPNWTWISHQWPAAWPFPKDAPFDLQAAKKYLIDQKIAPPVDPDKIASIEATDRQDVLQVATVGEARDAAEEDAWVYHVYFIDVIRKNVVAEVSGKTLHTFCGRPHGAFAFDGRHLVMAPTELDASSQNINALLVDTRSTPPAVTWSRPCRDFQVSGMRFERGLIVVSPTPERVTIWDPATARPVAQINDIHDSGVLAWSTDLTTFATGFHDQRTWKIPTSSPSLSCVRARR